MKLESILHSLTSDVTFVAERMNPYMVGIASGLSTKLIATTGQTLYSFCNGLHTDTCDRISEDMKSHLFPNVTEEWKKRMLSFEHVSFPTTCGYQHVWKDADKGKKYKVIQHFLIPGLGLAISLQDSIAHHFMGGAFAHCTGICVLEEKLDDEEDNEFHIENQDDIFSLFAWGSSANTRTARGNSGRQNILVEHRMRQQRNRSEGAVPVIVPPSAATGMVAIPAPTLDTEVPTVVAVVAAVEGTMAGTGMLSGDEGDESSSYGSRGFLFEDDDYESDVPTEKKQKVYHKDNGWIVT
jgi:hypothetical protein